MTEVGGDMFSVDGLIPTITETVTEMDVYAPCTSKIDYKINMINLCSVPTFNITFIFITFRFPPRWRLESDIKAVRPI